MRKWIIAVAILLTVPMVGAAAAIVRGPEPEQLVEGHTVFTVIQVRNQTGPEKEEFAAAVAVLVREAVVTTTYGDRFPGVLWFNDQYLVNPSGKAAEPKATYRYPCGAVIAVNEGDEVPRDPVTGVPMVPVNATYLESYRVTDPNDRPWVIDKWSYEHDGNLSTPDLLMWSVKTLSAGTTDALYQSGDNGTCGTTGGVAQDMAGCSNPLLPVGGNTPQDPAVFKDSEVYHDDGGGVNAAERRVTVGEGRVACFGGNTAVLREYNAVLFFFLSDLKVAGTSKNHAVASNDVSGCQPGTAWPCPGTDDNEEGNSHPYNPEALWPAQYSEGRGNHGGSTGCGVDASGNMLGGGAQYEHATCNIDIYFGKVGKAPTTRSYPTVFDVEGSTAPYHCHEHMNPCNEQDSYPSM